MTATAHNAIKAAVEELAGMQECWKTLDILSRDAERVMGEAEARHNALLKLRGFLAGSIENQHAKIAALREAAEAAAKQAETPP